MGGGSRSTQIKHSHASGTFVHAGSLDGGTILLQERFLISSAYYYYYLQANAEGPSMLAVFIHAQWILNEQFELRDLRYL